MGLVLLAAKCCLSVVVHSWLQATSMMHIDVVTWSVQPNRYAMMDAYAEVESKAFDIDA